MEVSFWDCLVQLHEQQPSAHAAVKMRQGELALVSSGMDILCSDLTSAVMWENKLCLSKLRDVNIFLLLTEKHGERKKT